MNNSPTRIEEIERMFNWYITNLEERHGVYIPPWKVFSFGMQYTQLVAMHCQEVAEIEPFTRKAFKEAEDEAARIMNRDD